MPRREQLLQLLQNDPHDPFLHYALALDDISSGNDDAGLERLTQLNADRPDYVPAWFQRGQVLARLDQRETARVVLRQGIQAAVQAGDDHAAAEMTALIETL
jgi:predicted RNA polymerase sigma factor